MKFKCNGCGQPVNPPRIFTEEFFVCKCCGMKYRQQIIRQITQES